jgi:hypothetical protein
MAERRLKNPPENLPHEAGAAVELEQVGETVQKIVEDPDVLNVRVEPHPDGTTWLIFWEYAVMDLDEHYSRIFQRQSELLSGVYVFPARENP